MDSISVIIPTFNNAQHIEEAIRTILNQTLQATEIIVIDDGSTDNTKSVLESINCSYVYYYRQENSGASSARNFGMKIAKGKYIAFLDADDLWLPNMLEEQAYALNLHTSAALSITNFIRFDATNRVKFLPQFSFYHELALARTRAKPTGNLTAIEGRSFTTLIKFGEFPAFTSAIMFRKSYLKGLLFSTKLKICEDAEFVLKVSTRGGAVFNDNILMEMRRHDSNTTKHWQNISTDKLQALLVLAEYSDLSSDQRIALNDRLIRANIDASTYQLRNGSVIEGLGYYINSLKIAGHPTRKVKGALRATIELVKRSYNTLKQYLL
ncbi:glycosyltransferase family 2 protein [Simiduia curdlanivorans]|uniref:Glycosyltransferase family 2 protein n=1 Tax=Simiduia curdlanivorans TaxID=1492769 RepID=A0ABV8VAY8_9GAMM|nr:glycosyltransferase family 2 protein [Simiduia curdlanivorans]MDN3638503.1 glycosyltransferase family 2 protein [Simiduia curdlanivorans]